MATKICGTLAVLGPVELVMWMNLEEAFRTGKPVFKDLKLTEEEHGLIRKGRIIHSGGCECACCYV